MEKRPKGMSYQLKTIVISIQLIILGKTSLRGTSLTFSFFDKYFSGGVPAHTTGQLWVLRFGLFKLQEAKEKRDDWIYILDHTIEYGDKKCLVILGVTRETLMNNNGKIRHQDVVVLDIDVRVKADYKSVKQRLTRAQVLTGTPIQIVSDGGGNIVRGVREFADKHESKNKARIITTYDATHKTAIILKKVLEKNDRWKLFSNNIANTKRCLVHTGLGFLAPPSPKEKSRWLNINEYISWVNNAILQDDEKMSRKDRQKYKQRLAWIKDFEKDIKEWNSMLDMINLMKNEIKNNCLSEKTLSEIKEALSSIDINTSNLEYVKNEILEYVKEETKNLTGLYLGTSDIIESIFGKYKKFSSKTPMKEVGKAILTMPIFTSDITPSKVKEAMETVSEKDVKEWLKENIGESLFCKRLKFCKLSRKNKKVGKENSRKFARGA